MRKFNYFNVDLNVVNRYIEVYKSSVDELYKKMGRNVVGGGRPGPYDRPERGGLGYGGGRFGPEGNVKGKQIAYLLTFLHQ